MESKYNQTDCCGLCDLEVCHNEDCPKWQELMDRDESELLWMLIHDDLNY